MKRLLLVLGSLVALFIVAGCGSSESETSVAPADLATSSIRATAEAAPSTTPPGAPAVQVSKSTIYWIHTDW